MSLNRGFTLLEVLVAVIVLAIGLLGLAKLQATGLRANHEADLRSRATLLAYDIADRVRANRIYYVDNEGNLKAPPSADAPGVECVWRNASTQVDVCTSAQMAAYDVYEWSNRAPELLPDGVGVVCLDSTADDGDPSDYKCDGSGSFYTVKIWWTEKDDGTGESVTRRYVTTFKP